MTRFLGRDERTGVAPCSVLVVTPCPPGRCAAPVGRVVGLAARAALRSGPCSVLDRMCGQVLGDRGPALLQLIASGSFASELITALNPYAS